MTLSEQEFRMVYTYILDKYGIDLSKKKFLIESKLTIMFSKLDIHSFSEFWCLVIGGKHLEVEQRLIDALTTNYSYFYREETHFAYLKETLLKQFKEKNTQTLYIWCAGCAGGQEAYSMAMLMLDAKKEGLWPGEFQVKASDISESALTMAKAAKYPISDYVRLPKSWQQSYCMFGNTSFEVKRDVRGRVHFVKENLFEASESKLKYHLIFCRNVLIYFNLETREQLLKRLVSSLMPGGYLIIGHSEVIHIDKLPLDYIQPSVYKKTERKAI